MSTVPRSIAWATDIDVLPADHTVVRHGSHLVVRSPGNPGHYWGNFLLFDEPPGPGDGAAWERAFARAFADEPLVRHRAFGWDRVDGALGAALEELAIRGYEIMQSVGLIATRAALAPHPRANREAVIRALHPGSDAAPGGGLQATPGEVALDPGGPDAELWRQVVELQVAGRDAEHFAEQPYREFAARRLRDLRALFRAGRGGWYVALLDGAVAGSCGIVVNGTRGRFQTVDTAAAVRRRGVCSRLLVDAAQLAARRDGAQRFVIVADPGYHALGLYESLGFERRERVAGAFRQP